MNDNSEKQIGESRRVLNIAHRGASAYERENTAIAMEKAVACGADMVEFDLRRTVDHKIILYHDPQIRTPSGKRIKVSSLTLDEIREISRHHGYAIATFEEILGKFGSLTAMDIEIKEEGFEGEVVRLLEEYPHGFDLIISSFKPEVLDRIRNMDNSLKTGLIIGPYRTDWMGLPTRLFLSRIISKSDYDSIHIHRSLVSPAICEKLRNAGIPMYVWTVNDRDEMKRLIDYGVDGIISDRPDIVGDIRDKAEAAKIAAASDRDRDLVEER
jgi:glycerophosphoryl diester phosphodiesterase